MKPTLYRSYYYYEESVCLAQEGDMATAVADVLELLKDIPVGAWVAISERQHSVLAYGPDAEAVLSEAQSKGEDHPLIVRVPDQTTSMFF